MELKDENMKCDIKTQLSGLHHEGQAPSIRDIYHSKARRKLYLEPIFIYFYIAGLSRHGGGRPSSRVAWATL
jgi:hypothetical protein